MAEERLIDDDIEKDKKYRFRTNEDGEEELIVSQEAEEQPAAEEIGFEVPEVTEDDEEAAVMTPEQLAEKLRRAEQAKAERDAKVALLLDSGERDCADGKYSTALECIRDAEALDSECGRLYCLKLQVYTACFTDYSQLDEAAAAAEGIARYAAEEEKKTLLAQARGGLTEHIDRLTETVERLSAENEEKKSERAVRFNAAKRKRVAVLSCVAVLFVALLVAAICFSTVMFSDRAGTFVVLTVVFGSLAFLAFLATAFCARLVNIASRRVRLNKRNSSTALGRQLEEELEKLQAFNAIYAALNGETAEE